MKEENKATKRVIMSVLFEISIFNLVKE